MPSCFALFAPLASLPPPVLAFTLQFSFSLPSDVPFRFRTLAAFAPYLSRHSRSLALNITRLSLFVAFIPSISPARYARLPASTALRLPFPLPSPPCFSPPSPLPRLPPLLALRGVPVLVAPFLPCPFFLSLCPAPPHSIGPAGPPLRPLFCCLSLSPRALSIPARAFVVFGKSFWYRLTALDCGSSPPVPGCRSLFHGGVIAAGPSPSSSPFARLLGTAEGRVAFHSPSLVYSLPLPLDRPRPSVFSAV